MTDFSPSIGVSFVAMFGLLVLIVLFGAGIGLAIRIGARLTRGGWFSILGIVAGGFLFFVVAGVFFSVISVRRVVPGDGRIVHHPPRVVQIEGFSPYGSDSSPLPRIAVHGAIASAPEQSLDGLWSQMYAPRIKLDGIIASPEALEPSTPREITDAARLILSASLPGADPFTQGWLINAAKSIMRVTPKPEASAIRSEEGEGRSQARPDWVSTPPNPAGDVRRVVSTDPWNTMEECRAQLEARLRFAVADRVRTLAKQTGQSTANGPMLADMGVTPDFILRELCPEGAYVETVNGSAGEMKRAHALVEFTPLKDEVLLNRWQTAMRAPGSASAVAALATTEALPRAASYMTGERPDWVVHPSKQVGNVRRFVVVSDPFSTVDEARKQVDHKMQELVLQRGRELASPLPGPSSLGELGIGGDFVRREHCTDEFVDAIETSVGEMARVHVLLEFNETQDRFLVDCMRRHARRGGLITTMLIAASVLGCVAMTFGLLKADTWTRGYYTKRLFLGVPAAIISLFFLAMLILDS